MERKLKNNVVQKNVKHEDDYSLQDLKNGKTSVLQNNTFYSDKGTRITADPEWYGMNMSSSASFNGPPDKSNIDYANKRLNNQLRSLFIKQKHDVDLLRKRARREKIKRVINILTGKVLYKRAEAFLVTNRPKFTYTNVKNYAKAELSKIEQGPVSLPIYEERKKICGECPHRKYVDGYKDPLGFCTKCGCGANPRAQLTVKLRLPATSCPLDKWGESKGIYEGFWGRIRYILSRNKKGQDNGAIQ